RCAIRGRDQVAQAQECRDPGRNSREGRQRREWRICSLRVWEGRRRHRFAAWLGRCDSTGFECSFKFINAPGEIGDERAQRFEVATLWIQRTPCVSFPPNYLRN